MIQLFSSLVAFVVILPSRLIRYLSSIQSRVQPTTTEPGHDHPLLTGHTDVRQYETSHATYSSIRTFYRPHAHSEKLKVIADLPLVVFLHGLGGSLPQFAPLLGSFLNVAPTFGIELPGHGQSDFSPKTYEAYTFEALTELWRVAIHDACVRHGHRKVVLIGHSLGCSFAAALAVSSSIREMEASVIGMVAICPRVAPPSRSRVKAFRRLLALPDIVLNILRWFDRFGGTTSKSVIRCVGEAADIDLKRLQLRYNKSFKTPVLKRVSLGLLPDYDLQGVPRGGMPGSSMWENIKVPMFLIGAEADMVNKPTEVSDIFRLVRKEATAATDNIDHPSSAGNVDQPLQINSEASEQDFGIETVEVKTLSKHSTTVKSVVIPAPASHALLYDHATYRTVAGLIEDFFSKYVAHELELGWQLQQLTTSGKWDVKNLEKWKKVSAVSGPIDNGLFRALKTLREQDEEHTPHVFLQRWKQEIFAIIDISHDSPIYDTTALERGGVEYHKFPTVSKIPPTVIEVHNFIALVDRLRKEIGGKYAGEDQIPAVGVHCHYGYNRTGFFIVCYLIERRGYRVQEAIDEFARHKPPGIRHDHFIDTLFVRYCVGLRRSSISRESLITT